MNEFHLRVAHESVSREDVRVSDEGARFALDSVTFALIQTFSLTAIVFDARLMMMHFSSLPHGHSLSSSSTS